MPKAKILIVEDNKLNLELAQDLLEVSGYQVLAAVDAEQGLILAREEAPDIVLMDISLPGMDGLEATRRLKADQDTRNIPVICLTAHAMQGDMEKADQAGAEGYITKPIDTRKFTDQIASYIKR